jgi:hypothetical protein
MDRTSRPPGPNEGWILKNRLACGYESPCGLHCDALLIAVLDTVERQHVDGIDHRVLPDHDRRCFGNDQVEDNLDRQEIDGSFPTVLTKETVAQANEILCKCLCHNICVLIASIYELGIEPEFWAGGEAS